MNSISKMTSRLFILSLALSSLQSMSGFSDDGAQTSSSSSGSLRSPLELNTQPVFSYFGRSNGKVGLSRSYLKISPAQAARIRPSLQLQSDKVLTTKSGQPIVDLTPWDPVDVDGLAVAMDDVGTPDVGHFEYAFVFSTRKNEEGRLGERSLEIGYGLKDNLGIAISLPQLSRSDDDGRVQGLGNPELEVKYRFLDKNHVQVAITTSYQMPGSAKSSELELAERAEALASSIQAQVQLNKNDALFCDYGNEWRRGESTAYHIGVGYQHRFTDRFSASMGLVADDQHYGSQQTNWSQVTQFRLGAVIGFGRSGNQSLIIGYGRNLCGNDHSFTIGFRFEH